MFKGAGVLPYAFENNKLYFLLGKEKYEQLFSDFGGGVDHGEKPYETAYREFVEETMNSLKETEEVKRKLYKSEDQLSYFNQGYYTYLIEISKDDQVVNSYNRIFNNLANCKCPVGLCEKSEFRWFTPEEILKNEKLMRPKFFDSYLKILFSLLS